MWNKKNNTKYLLRKIVERHIGKKTAFRKKYGFAQPVWKNTVISNELKMKEELESSNFFSNGNFKESSKDFLIKESKNSSQRHLWMAYCVIKSTKYIKELKYQKE